MLLTPKMGRRARHITQKRWQDDLCLQLVDIPQHAKSVRSEVNEALFLNIHYPSIV